MDKKVWIFQYTSEVRKKGAAEASWYVGWYDHGGKRRSESCGPGARGKNKAEKRQRRIQAELDFGVRQTHENVTWKQFRKEYEVSLAAKPLGSREQIRAALDHFQRIVQPGRVGAISSQTIDSFVAKRRLERGKNPGSVVSPATINKDLRHIKAALRVAADWEYLSKMPKIRMVRQPEKLIVVVTPDHFEKLCREGSLLAALPVLSVAEYTTADWWRALLTIARMTGTRIREILALRWEDVDLEKRIIVSRHDDNKGKRTEEVPIHPVVVEALAKLKTGSSPRVFPWPHSDGDLWKEFGQIQRKLGINLICREKHKHTPACHVYGFHDLKRTFCTENAPHMAPHLLQRLARHKDYKTTLGYVNVSEQLRGAVDQMPVPGCLQKSTSPEPRSAGEQAS